MSKGVRRFTLKFEMILPDKIDDVVSGRLYVVTVVHKGTASRSPGMVVACREDILKMLDGLDEEKRKCVEVHLHGCCSVHNYVKLEV